MQPLPQHPARLPLRRLSSVTAPLLLLAAAATLHAQYQPFALLPREEGSRRQRVEVYGSIGYWHSDDVTLGSVTLPDFEGGFVTADTTLRYDDTAVFNFGFGWAINDHFTVRMEFDYADADYRAEWNDSWLSGDMLMSDGRVNLDYHVLAGPITPYVTGGIGYHYFDTGIPKGPPDYYCWWDYGWGYVCTGYVDTYNEFDFAANAGAGLRWDITDTLFLKAQGLVNWVDMGRGAGWTPQFQATFVFGAKL